MKDWGSKLGKKDNPLSAHAGKPLFSGGGSGDRYLGRVLVIAVTRCRTSLRLPARDSSPEANERRNPAAPTGVCMGMTSLCTHARKRNASVSQRWGNHPLTGGDSVIR